MAEIKVLVGFAPQRLGTVTGILFSQMLCRLYAPAGASGTLLLSQNIATETCLSVVRVMK